MSSILAVCYCTPQAGILSCRQRLATCKSMQATQTTQVVTKPLQLDIFIVDMAPLLQLPEEEDCKHCVLDAGDRPTSSSSSSGGSPTLQRALSTRSSVNFAQLGAYPSTAELQRATIWSPSTGDVKAGRLWAAKPVVIMAIRRPGCVLCRYQARELWLGLKNPLERHGVDVACVVHEWRDREVQQFGSFWPGPVYHDKEMAFFKAYKGVRNIGQQMLMFAGGLQTLGGGAPIKLNTLTLLNPFAKVWKRIREAKRTVTQYNFVGTANIAGGVFVIRRGGGLQYMHMEKDIGLPAPHEHVLEAALQAASNAPAMSTSFTVGDRSSAPSMTRSLFGSPSMRE